MGFWLPLYISPYMQRFSLASVFRVPAHGSVVPAAYLTAQPENKNQERKVCESHNPFPGPVPKTRSSSHKYTLQIRSAVPPGDQGFGTQAFGGRFVFLFLRFYLFIPYSVLPECLLAGQKRA